ncbi:hypothetical protein [Actinomadura sp. DC4]|uniref:hypothetical protein n=1 Tax=Actinomadura sp. DC4 TaxID=3055069 RepID=UPI0025B07A75|nr:hypothetical protein [Actinomadura sp. DC4]MDN3352473.1 hypothetical protein [Actinomadura sp. DC4]
MRRHRLSVLLAIGSGLILCPGAIASTDPGGRRRAAPDQLRATTGSTAVTFQVLPGPTISPTVTPTAPAKPGAAPGDEGPSSFAGSGNDQSVALDADHGGHSGGVSFGQGGHTGRTGRTGRQARHPGRHGHPRTPSVIRGRTAGGAHAGKRPGHAPRRGRLPFTGGDVGATVLAGMAAVLAGSIALCRASVRRRLTAVTRGRRHAHRSH